jgi:hypothetical protein
MGGAVVLGEQRENLCRVATEAERGSLGGHPWIVESQGLPNLVHEVIHALFLGRLADDHGFDYGQIPLDLCRFEHRRHLWEELACCMLSTVICAAWEHDPAEFEREWFSEQFEIQGVFHGLDGDLAGFRSYIDAQLAKPSHLAELVETVELGRSRLAAALARVGGPVEVAECDVEQLWTRYRSTWISRMER